MALRSLGHRSCRWLALALLLASGSALAEGSRSLFPSSTSGARAASNLGGGTYVGVVKGSQFIYVYAKAGEYIELGSSNVGGTASATQNDIFVYNPQSFGTKGNETIPGTINFKCSSQSGKGRILTRAAELAGPNSANGTTTVTNGYAPCYYVAPSTGIYGVRFLAASGTASGSYNSLGTVGTLTDSVEAWDVTVRATASDVNDFNGRVFTYAWAANTAGNGSAYRIQSNLYYVSVDGYRYRQTLRGIDPNAGVFYANASGFLDSNGAPLYHDYRGSNQNVAATTLMTNAGVTAQIAQYPLFFNDVSPSGSNAAEVNAVLSALAIPQTPPSPQLSDVSFTGNVGGNTSTYSSGGTYTFTTVNTQTYQIVIRRGTVAAGADPNFPAGCVSDFDPANICNRTLTGIATTGTHNISWDGKDNSGFSFPTGSYSYQIMGRNGEIHFPMLDIEGNVNGGPTLQKLNGAADSTVYFDDRGYKSANGTAVGTLNGNLCGGASVWTSVPSPDHSLLGIDSVANPTYRTWGGSNNDNSDCNRQSQYFGDAKGLDIWGFEKTAVFVNPIVIVPLPINVDVGTSVSVTSSVIAGGTAYGNFSFFNAGASTATGVTYSAKLGNPAVPATCPAAVTFTLLPAGVTATYNPVPACTITFTGLPTSLTGGQALNFGFNYVVAPTNPGPIPLATTIAAANENCTTSCSANTATAQTLVAKPIVTVVKSASPAAGTQVDIGDTITYTISVNVDSAPLTSSFTLTDTLGAGLTFGSVQSASPAFSCSGSLTCTLPSATATGAYTVTYTATVDNSASGSVANSVVPSGGGGDNPPACDPCSVTHNVNQPNVTVSKSGPTSAVTGSSITYTLGVANTGSAPTAGNVIVQDQLPAGVSATAASGASCTPLNTAGALLTCIVPGPLAATNGAATITITATAPATVPAGGSITNYAATHPGGSGNPPTAPGAGCNAATTSCSSAPTTITSPQLSITKSGPATAVVGVGFSYVLTVTNGGSAATTAPVTVRDAVPSGLTIASLASDALWDCAASTSAIVSCTTSGTLAVGASSTITVNVIASASASSSVTNTATIGGGGDPACPTATPCASNPVVTTMTSPKLSIAKTSNGPWTIGQSGATYTLTVTNTGTASTTGTISVRDTLPTGISAPASFTSGAWNCTTVGQAVTCTTNTIILTTTAPGNTSAITVPVTVAATAAGSPVNNASVGGGGDPNNGGNPPTPGTCVAGDAHCASTSTTVIAPPNIAKAFGASSVPLNGNTSLTFTITNPSANTVALTGVSFTDALPSGLVVASPNGLSNTCGGTATAVVGSGSVSLSGASIPAGGFCAVTVNVTGTTAGTKNNSVTVSSTNGGTGNTGTATTAVVAPPSIAKSFSPATIPVNGTTTLSFTITNPAANTVALTGVAFTDAMPAAMTVVSGSAATCGGTLTTTAPNTIALSGATIAAGGQCAFNVTVTGANPGSFTNTTGQVTSTNGGSGNTASANLTVTAPTVTYSKSVAESTAKAGDTLHYTLTAVVGNASLTGAFTLSDTLGAGQTFAAVTGMTPVGSFTPVNTSGNPMTFTLPSGTAAGTYTLTYTTTVSNTATGSITNAVSGSGGGTGVTPACSASGACNTSVTVTASAVTYAKSVVESSAKPGDTLHYTLTAVVDNSALTSALVLSDTLGAGQTFVAVTSAGSFGPNDTSGNPMTFTLPSGTTPGTYALTYTTTVNAGATGPFTNAVTGSGGGSPTCAAAGSCNTSVAGVPVLTVSKSGPATATVGIAYDYTITVTNTGSADATAAATVTDTVPNGLTINSTTPASPTCTVSAQTVTCAASQAALAAGQSVTFTINVTPTAAAGGSVSNTAHVGGGGDPDCTTGTPCDSTPVTTTLQNAPPTVAKAFSPAAVNAGQVSHLTITLRNNGAAVATLTASLVDTLPAGVVLADPPNVSTLCTGGTATGTAGGDTITLASGAQIPAGAPGSCTISADVVGTIEGTHTNTIAAGALETNQGNNAAPAQADLTVAYDFCPAQRGGSSPIFSVVNGVQLWAYEPPGTSDTHLPIDAAVSTDLNALMIDPVRNRPLFVQRVDGTSTMLWAYDLANGGWYPALAAAVATPDFPRGGMTKTGVGYLIAGNTNTPAVWRVDLDATDPNGFRYALTSVGNLSYDANPTNSSSGDIAFDSDGDGWISAGQDLYRVDMTTLLATRQIRPTLGGTPSTISWAGIAFADDGKLYVADNSASSAYYAYDPANGVLTQAAPTGAGSSRDLASCAFPEPPTPNLHVVKTLYQVNGATPGAYVLPGDQLTYAITVDNTGTGVGTLYAGYVDETVPADSTHAGGDDFTCSPETAGSTCGNTNVVNIPANDSVTLYFKTTLAAPIAGNGIVNTVAVSGIDCDAAPNDCSVVTPVGSSVTVDKVSNPGSGATVTAGQTITYTVTVTVANAPLTSTLTLTDTLTGNQTLGTVTSGAFNCSGTGPLVCTLAAATAPGTYTLTYQATVNANATGPVGNVVVPTGGTPEGPACTTCSTTHPLANPAIAVMKLSNPPSGASVTAGQTITYTLLATVSQAALTSPLVLTDTLSANQTFGSVTAAGSFTCTGSLQCTLPTGAVPGTYALNYTATVNNDASGSVGNNVVPSGGSPTPPTCATCSTTHPLANPAITVVKSSNPASGASVTAGQTITYTLTATVTRAALTSPLVLTDALSANQTFGSVTAAGSFTCTGSVQCTLPSGTVPGTYAVSYTATVNNDATGSVSNNVVPGGGSPTPPTCTTCSTTHPLANPAITVVKSSNPASGTSVTAGQTITYTLTATVTQAALTSPLVLIDTLSANQTFGSVTAAGSFTCTGSLQCTLPSGTVPGTYAVSYTATVNNNATGAVGNNVVPSGGSPTPPTCATCSTTHPLKPTVTVTKSSNPTSGSTVSAGDTITYTVQVVVANAPLANLLTLTDTLSANQTLGTVTNGSFSCSGALVCTLPAGTAPGTYTLTYAATVNANASGNVTNAVVPSGGDNPTCSGSCSTTHPLADPAIAVVKSSNPTSGTSVTAGQTITYTLTATVTQAALTSPLVLADTLSANQTFGSVTAAGSFTCTGSLQCTLPSGTVPGTYAVSYTATVNNDASGSVGNNVVASGGSPTPPTCTTCSTTHPLANPKIVYSKTSNPASGSTVTAGQTITYTLKAVVSDAALISPLVLTDTPSANQTFDSVTAAGSFTCTGSVQCTLPSGTVPGTYTVSYTATVNNNASGSVGNNVAATGGSPTSPTCDPTGACTTTHPLANPAIVVAKSSDPASGQTVTQGQTITYTLTATVTQAALTSPLVLTDTLSANQTYIGVGAVNEGFTPGGSGSVRTFTLPSGTVPGTYHVEYTVSVNDDATGSVGNNVVPSGGSSTPPTCPTCTTTHPLAANVSVAKALIGESGSVANVAEPGETLTYRITLSNSGGVAATNVGVTDPLDPNVTFVSADNGGTSAAGTVTWSGLTVPAGGSLDLTVVVQVATPIPAGVTSIANVAYQTGSTPPACPGADPACVTTPTVGDVTIAKALTGESGTVAGVAEPGENLTYTITLTNTGGSDVTGYGLSDALPANTTFVSATDGGALTAGVINWTGLTVPRQIGATPGTKTVTVVVKVANPIPAGVTSIANVAYQTGSTPPSCPGADPACVTTPTVGGVTIAKALTGESGTVAGVAEPGENLTYTITLTNTGGSDVTGYDLSDALPANTTFVSATDGGALTAGVINWTGLTVPRQIGATPGTKTVTVVVKVANPIPAGVTSIANVAYQTGSTPPACPGNDPACVTTPTASNISVTKALSGESIATDGIAEPGEELTYTITVRNEGGTATTGTIVNETVPANTTFVGPAATWSCAANAAAGTACDALLNVPASTGVNNPGVATVTFTVKVDDPLPDNVTSVLNAVALDDGTPPDCVALPTAPGCVVVPTANVRMTKTVASVLTTGAASYQVNYAIDVVNVGGSAATYTLTDTLGFPNSGIVFIGNAQVATTGGTLNPALPGGQFTPMNGAIEQLSASGVNLAVGATHTYMVSVRVGVQPGSLQDGGCTGAAGHGFYNEASLSGTLSLESAACAPVDGNVPLIRLVKTVALGTDVNGDHYGDVGDSLDYGFEISNPGTLPLSAVQLFDPRLESLACDPLTANGIPFRVIPGDEIFFGPFNAPPGGTLDPGDSVACSGTYTLTADDVARRRVVNSATATGNAPGGQAVSSVSTAIFTQFR